AGLWGFGRTAAAEYPNLRCKRIDLGDASESEQEALLAELLATDDEDEIALRGAARYVHRYVRRPLEKPAPGAGERPFRVEVAEVGVFDKLTPRALARQAPPAGHVEIEVGAAALNFSDVMKALGLYPGLPDGPVPLGIECAGRVVSVGAGVTDVKAGDA